MSIKKTINTLLFTLILAFNLNAQVTRVNINSPCLVGCDGSTWALAYADLKDAIDNTTTGEIWVAQGTYTPDAANRDSSFILKNNVAFYGGFVGTETTRNERDYANNITILSGDLSGNDAANFTNYTENSYHVVRATKVDNTAILDGFTIQSGNANAITFPDYIGGGLYNDGEGGGNASTPIVQNCHFTANFADRSGGAIFNYGGTSGNANMSILNTQFTLNYSDDGGALYNDGQGFGQANPVVEGCYFAANTAINGGAIYNYGIAVGNSNPTIVNTLIIGNKADRGGAMYNDGSAVGNANGNIVNSTFSGNEAVIEGSAVYNFGGFGGNCSPVFTNCVFWDNSTPTTISSIHNSDATPFINFSLIEETTCSGINSTCDANTIFNQDPQFNSLVTAAAPTVTGDFQFLPCSPLRDAGNNAVINATTFTIDYQDSSRIYTDTVDIGAYEFNNTPAELAITTVITDSVSCPGASDASINLTLSDGLLPYSFGWNNGIGAVEDPSGLAAGIYIITVTDGYGCLQTDTVNIPNPDTIQTSIVITSNYNGFDISCPGATDGAVDLTATGGAGNYTYLWSYNGLITEDPNTLGSGKHYVTVTDGNGCSVVDSITLAQPNNLTASASVTSNYNGFDISCPNANDATIVTTITGGQVPFTFAWTGGLAAVQNPINVAAGSYTVTATDANGCQILTFATVTAPPSIAANLTISSNYNGSNITCIGASDGSIDANTAGGASPYTYNWDNGIGAVEDPTNLSTGKYKVTITDNNGCTQIDSITLSDPNPIVPTAVATSIFNGFNISCKNGNDGAIDLTTTGGSGTFTYNWDNGIGAVEDPNGLTAGTYNVTVTDANGCTETTNITLTEPTIITNNIVITTNYNGFDVSCAGADDGAVDLTAAGGVAPYTFFWDGGIGAIEDPNTLDTGTYNVVITDANGCIENASITLNGPAGIDLTIVVSSNYNGEDISCVGATDGAIDLSVIGGAMPYTYTWDNGIANIQDPNGLTAGMYNVTVTDANGCSNQTSITLNNPPALGGTIVESTPIDCNGNSTGALDLTATGGVAPYTYNWDNGIGAVEDPTNLATGTYNVTITDANNCQFTTAFTLNEPIILTANAAASTNFNGFNISCKNGNDGAIDLTANGGTAPYTYNWDNAIGAVEDPNGLIAGTYDVTVMDANGCTETTNITLTEPTIVTSNIVITTNYNGFDVSCAGADNGAVDLTAAGGVAPYTFLWDGGIGAIEDPNTLDTGTYNVVITDANGCIENASISLTGPAGIDLTIAVSSNYNGEDISCVGASDGAIDLNVSGGAMPYTYTWDNGIGNIQDPNGLIAGTYNVTVTDANGCSNPTSITLNNPPVLGGTIVESTPIDCNGNSTGALDLTATGGVAPYTYNWDNGIGAVEDPTNLGTGTYNVTITDANNCQFTTAFILNEPTTLTGNAIVTTNFNGFNVSCENGNDGAIDLTANGGTAPYSYNWDNGIGAMEDPASITAGTYNVTVTDANGCTETTNITLTEPTALNLAAIVTSNYNGLNVSCIGVLDGSADLTVNGGIPNYTYLWSNNSILEDPNNLDTGFYQVIVTDLNGCVDSTNITLTGPNPIIPTAVVSSNFNGSDISCVGENDGSIDLTVLGGSMPYLYNWNNNFSNNEDINGLIAGNYKVIVTDANGCKDSTDIQLNDPIPLALAVVQDSLISCNGFSNGGINTTITGGTNTFTFTWDNGIGNIEDPNGLMVGNYHLTVTDGNGCIAMDSIILTEPIALTANAIPDTIYNGFEISCNGSSDGAIDLTVSGGILPYSYLWSNGDTLSDIDSLVAGSYMVTVTDSLGCQITTSITLNEPTILTATTISINPTCLGISNGSIDLTATGGVAPYTYDWDNGIGATEDPTNITAGTYTVTITDANDCIFIISTTLTGNTTPFSIIGTVSSNYNGQSISCPTSTDGSIDISPVPLGIYTYNWDNGLAATEDQTNLGAGIYSVTATDGNGCQDTISVAIVAPDSMVTNISVLTNYNGSAVSCNGSNDAALDLNIVSGGIAPYSYLWSNGDTIQDPTSISAGTSLVTVTDQNGCSVSDSILLSEPTVIVLSAVVSSDYGGNDISCSGAMDGEIDLTATGGIAPYGYLWSNGDTIQDPDSLSSGLYQVTITDANGCQETTSITISEPTNSLIVVATSGFPVCENESNGIIALNVTGSTGSVIYDWNNGLPSTISQQNVSPGTYMVTVTDGLGCFAIDTVVVDSLFAPQVAFSADSVCIGLETSFFDNSTMTIGATYAWNFDNNITIDDNTVGNTMYEYPTAGNFEAVLTITSIDGCVNSDTIDVFVEDLIVDFTGLGTEYCANDEPIELIGIPAGGTFSGTGITGNFFDPSAVLVGTNAVSYTYSNLLGCTETVSQNTQILSLPSLNAGEDIEGFVNTPIQLEAIGAQSYLWSPSTGLDADNISNPETILFGTQVYIVTGTDASGCSVQDTVTVNIESDLNCLKLRTVFSPNGDNVNDQWSIECISFYDNEVEVYNRWGQLVFQATNYSNTWDGLSQATGEPLPEDSYFYVVRITNDNFKRTFKGAVTIVR
jgi:gliding motility-associated-like protein